MARQTSSDDTSLPALLSDAPKGWRLGLIVGSTATGKTTALADLQRAGLVGRVLERGGELDENFSTPKTALISAVARSAVCACGADEAARVQLAIDRLSSVGLSELPAWLRPYSVLSTAQRARAALAATLESRVAVDDFAACVDERVACVAAHGVARLVARLEMEGVVLACTQPAVVPYASPDWVYFPETRTLRLNPAPLSRPPVSVTYDDSVTDDAFAAALPAPPPQERCRASSHGHGVLLSTSPHTAGARGAGRRRRGALGGGGARRRGGGGGIA